MNNPMDELKKELAKHGDLYWAYNLPLQMWPTDGGWRALNYMPRRERAEFMEGPVSAEELPAFCEKAASVLENLASLFRALGRREIDTIYYADQSVAEAVANAKEENE